MFVPIPVVLLILMAMAALMMGCLMNPVTAQDRNLDKTTPYERTLIEKARAARIASEQFEESLRTHYAKRYVPTAPKPRKPVAKVAK